MKTLIEFRKATDKWHQSTVDFRKEYAAQMMQALQSMESKRVIIEERAVNSDSSAYRPDTIFTP